MPKEISGSEFRRLHTPPHSGIYLFFGQEEYTKHRCLEQVRTQLCADADTAVFNHIKLSADQPQFSLDAVANAYRTLPFFGGDKLTEVHGLSFASMRENELKHTLALFDALLAETDASSVERCVMIVYCLPDELDGGCEKRPSSVLKKLSETVQCVRFDRESNASLLSWTARHFASEGILASRELCSALIQRCGGSMFTLHNEIQKLTFYLKKNGRDRAEEIDLTAIVPQNDEIGTFDFTNALCDCNLDGALLAFCDLRARHAPPELIMGSMVSTYSLLYHVKAGLEENMTVSEIASLYKLNEARVNIYTRACRNFSLSFLAGAVRGCHDTDLKIKTSAVEPYAAMETLLCTLVPRRRTR